MNWARLIEWARSVLRQKEQLNRLTNKVGEQQEAMQAMATVIRHHEFELIRLRDNEAHEREMLALRLENLLLRERGLPVPTTDREVELLQQIRDLKRENAEI